MPIGPLITQSRWPRCPSGGETGLWCPSPYSRSLGYETSHQDKQSQVKHNRMNRVSSGNGEQLMQLHTFSAADNARKVAHWMCVWSVHRLQNPKARVTLHILVLGDLSAASFSLKSLGDRMAHFCSYCSILGASSNLPNNFRGFPYLAMISFSCDFSPSK